MESSLFLLQLFRDPIYFCRVVVILVLSVTIHELSHGFAAISQGDDTPEKLGHMTPNPVVHMGVPSIILLLIAGITWGQMPVNPSKFTYPRLSDIIVAAAGPLSNLTLAILATLVVVVANLQNWPVSTEFFSIAAFINMMLCFFNLLPFPPLDGFTIASEMFPSLRPLRNSPFGFFCMMLLFMVPGVTEGLGRVSSSIILWFVRLFSGMAGS
jgi:Zn-dependent protease